MGQAGTNWRRVRRGKGSSAPRKPISPALRLGRAQSLRGLIITDEPKVITEPGKSTLTQAKRDTETHRAELLRLDVDERRGEVVRVSKVVDALAAAGEKIVRIIDQLPMDADDLATSVARGGSQALRAALKEIARRMRTRIADSLSLGAE